MVTGNHGLAGEYKENHYRHRQASGFTKKAQAAHEGERKKMFNDIKYQYRLCVLQKQKKKIHNTRDKNILLAKSSGKSQAYIYELYDDYDVELQIIDDEIRKLQQDCIINLADRFLIPVPQMSVKDGEYEYWEQSSVSGRYQLKDASLVALRSAIRTERKERREAWLWMVSGFTGLGGVAIGILSLILKK